MLEPPSVLCPHLAYLLEASELDVKAACAGFLHNMGYDVKETLDYVWGLPPGTPHAVCLVAHVDTVRPAHQKMVIQQEGDVIRNAGGVLGADDRAGVYAITRVLETLRRTKQAMPAVLFTTGEERGGTGATAFTVDHDLAEYPFIKLLLELGREGANQYVYYSPYLPESLHELAKRNGMVEAYGSFSDVAILTDASCVPHLNVSIGYMSQHTKQESLNLTWMTEQIDRVLGLLADDIPREYIAPWEFETALDDDFFLDREWSYLP